MAEITRRRSGPVTFLVPGRESAEVSLTRGRAAVPLIAGIGGTIKHSVLLSSQRAASGATVPVTAVPGEDLVILHIDGGPSLVLHPENARDLLRSQSGDAGAVRGGTRAATAVAETDCKLLAINRNAFLHLVKTSPAFGASLLAGLAERAKDMAVRNK